MTNFHVNFRIYYSALAAALASSTKKLARNFKQTQSQSPWVLRRKKPIPIKIKDFFDISRKKVKKKVSFNFFRGEEEWRRKRYLSFFLPRNIFKQFKKSPATHWISQCKVAIFLLLKTNQRIFSWPSLKR